MFLLNMLLAKRFRQNHQAVLAAVSINGLGHSNLITCLTSFFEKKNPVRLQKKKKKKSSLVSYGRKWF